MAYTPEQVAKLEEAISQGALRVKYGDKEVEYRTLKEMQIILNTMKCELGLIKPGSGRKFASYTKGLR